MENRESTDQKVPGAADFASEAGGGQVSGVVGAAGAAGDGQAGPIAPSGQPRRGCGCVGTGLLAVVLLVVLAGAFVLVAGPTLFARHTARPTGVELGGGRLHGGHWQVWARHGTGDQVCLDLWWWTSQSRPRVVSGTCRAPAESEAGVAIGRGRLPHRTDEVYFGTVPDRVATVVLQLGNGAALRLKAFTLSGLPGRFCYDIEPVDHGLRVGHTLLLDSAGQAVTLPG